MSAATLQGAPFSTIDTDIWLDLPERFYFKPIHIAKSLGAAILAPTVVGLPDDTIVNFCYRLDGLRSFSRELTKCVIKSREGVKVPVLTLKQIIVSKTAANREKDWAVLPSLRKFAQLKQKAEKRHGKFR